MALGKFWIWAGGFSIRGALEGLLPPAMHPPSPKQGPNKAALRVIRSFSRPCLGLGCMGGGSIGLYNGATCRSHIPVGC